MAFDEAINVCLEFQNQQNVDVFRHYTKLAGIDFKNPEEEIIANVGPDASQVERIDEYAFASGRIRRKGAAMLRLQRRPAKEMGNAATDQNVRAVRRRGKRSRGPALGNGCR